MAKKTPQQRAKDKETTSASARSGSFQLGMEIGEDIADAVLGDNKPKRRIIGDPRNSKISERINSGLMVYWEKPRRESSYIKAFAYSEENAELALKFTMGQKVYTYTNVPIDIYRTMITVDQTPDSLGSWLIQNVTKSDKYPFVKEN